MKPYIYVIYTLLFLSIGVSAQKMSIGYIYPAGGKRGTTFEIEVGGLNIMQTNAVFVSGAGVKAEIMKQNTEPQKSKKKKFDDQSSPQLAERLKIMITIDKSAVPGLRDLRLQTEKGVSNKLPFEVGQYPDFREMGTQNSNFVSQLPATLCGQIMPGERDLFTFKIEKGATFVAAAKARAFVPYIADAVPGWFQAVMTLKDSEGHEIAYSDDFRNSVDPVIITNIAKSDIYTLEIHDAIFRGREDFNYRIEVGQIPYLNSVYPAVGNFNKTQQINLIGVNFNKKTIHFKPDFLGNGQISVKSPDGYISNPLPFFSYDKSIKIANRVALEENMAPNSILFDSIHTGLSPDSIFFELKKNEKLIVDVKARRLGSMLDGILSLYDSSGKKVAEADDSETEMDGLSTHHADPYLVYTAPKSDKYKLIIRDVLRGFGRDYFYSMERQTVSQNFELFVSPATIIIPKGGTGSFFVDVVSKNKKNSKLNLQISGLPKDFVVSSLDLRGNKWEVSVTAPETAKEQALNLKVMAYTPAGNFKDEQITMQQAVAADNMMQAFYCSHHIPATNFVAQITKEPPFSLHFSTQTEENLQKPILVSVNDSILAIKVFIRRNAGFNEAVSLKLARQSKQITLDPVELKPGETEKELILKLDLKAFSKNIGIRRSLSIVGMVNAQIDKKGKRSFENAKFIETTPILILELTP